MTPTEYLATLPAERRAAVTAVRKVIRKHLPKGYREMMSHGMIGYGIPLSRYPETYNGRPLTYAGLVARKDRCTVYLMGVYGDPRQLRYLRQAFKDAGKTLRMGKSCIHFKAADDLPLAAIGKLIGWWSVKDYIANYEASRSKRQRR